MDGDVGELEPWHTRESGPGGRRDVDKKIWFYRCCVVAVQSSAGDTTTRGKGSGRAGDERGSDHGCRRPRALGGRVSGATKQSRLRVNSVWNGSVLV